MTFSDLQPKLKYKLTLNLVTLSAACLFIHVNWSAETGQIDFLSHTDSLQVNHFRVWIFQILPTSFQKNQKISTNLILKL